MMPATKTNSRTTHCTARSRTSRSLRSAAALGLGLLSLLSLSAGTVAYAGTVNWDNTPGDWFANPSHWDNGAYPGATDDAVNMSTAAMTLGQSTTINSFFSNGAFTLQGGTFSGNQADSASTLTVNNVFTDDGGQINNFTVNQGFGGSLVFTGSGGNSLNNSIVNAKLDLATNANAYVQLFNTDTLNGTTTLGTTSNGLALYNNATNLVNAGTLQGFGAVFQQNGGATFTNSGTVNANVAGQTLAISTDNFTNSGTTEATSGGILTLAGNTTTTSTGLLAASSGGILDISGTLNSNTGNSINGVGGTINIVGASLLGTINGMGATSLVFNGSGGNNFNNTTVNTNLDLATNANAYIQLFNTDTLNGTTTLGTTSNGLALYNSATNLVNNGSLTGFGAVFQQNGGATFINSGTVNANSAGSTLAISTDNFTNSGTTEATNGGILTLAGNTTTTDSGAIKAVGTGSVVSIAGSLTGSGSNLFTASGGGTINIVGASLLGTINGMGATSLVFNGSGSNNFNNTTVNTNLDLATNANAYIQLLNTDTLNGTTTLGTTSNGLALYNNATNLVNAGTLQGFGAVFQQNGGATFTNSGTVNANVAGQTLAISTDNFTNSGTTEATSGGILTLAGNTTTTSTGLLAASSGGILDISGTLNSNTGNSINGVGGTINIVGASLLGTINGMGATSLVFNGSGGNNFNNTTVNANLDLATNANTYIQLLNTDTLNGTTTLGTTSNGLALYNSATNLVNNGSLTGFGAVFQQNGGATFTNSGTVNANSAGSTLAISTDNFTNSGTTEATNGGILTLAGNTTTTDSGAIKAVGTGSIVSISGALTGTTGNLFTSSGGGQIQVNGAGLFGTINGASGTSLIFNGDGRNNFNNTTVNANLDLATNANTYIQLLNTDTLNGTTTLGTTSNGLALYNNATNLVNTGTLQGFGSVSQQNGGATFINSGTVNANSVGNTLAISTDNFNNSGTVEVQNGATLTTAGNTTTTDSGNILVKSGGTATFGNPLTQTAGLTQVDGTLNSPLTLTGGTLAGTGTVNGAVANTGGTVSAGNAASPFGTLALSNTFSQTAGALDVGFSNTQNNLLAVTGMVTTGGMLNVNYLGSGPFTAGNTPFTFLDYGSLVSSISATGPTQYFSNEMFDMNGNGLITGSNGFTYELLNNTSIDGLQLEVVTNGAPTPAVPEASTTVSMGLLLMLGSLGLLRAKRRATVR